jgi:hypothetical protein
VQAHIINILILSNSSSFTTKVGEMLETTHFGMDRLNEAAWLDDEKLEPLVKLINPKKGSVLHHGMVSKESGSSLSSAASGMQTRYFVIDVDGDWRPRLSYYKDVFEAPICQPGSRPNALGTFNLASFTFTPTKQARSSQNLRSWRLDVTGPARGSLSGSKRDKLVLEFSSDQDCYEWQAAFKICQLGLQNFLDGRASLESRLNGSIPDAAPVIQNQAELMQLHASTESQAAALSSTSVLCGQSLSLEIPPLW